MIFLIKKNKDKTIRDLYVADYYMPIILVLNILFTLQEQEGNYPNDLTVTCAFYHCLGIFLMH